MVRVVNRQRGVSLDLARLQALATAAVAQCVKYPGPVEELLGGLEEVDVVVVSDRVIARVHRQFMNVLGATDVITFAHGEIVLSASTAARQAREHSETPDREAARYIVHGLLHLNGHEDADPVAAARMWQAQEDILQTLWPVDAA